MKKVILLGIGPSIAAALLALPAAAHPGHGDEVDLAFGVLHPIGDLENLFLMIVTGVFALTLIRMMGARR